MVGNVISTCGELFPDVSRHDFFGNFENLWFLKILWIFLVHWFSLIFIDFHWFSLISIDFHWFSLIFKVFGGTRPSPESAKALKKYFQTFSDTSETYVSEGKSLPASLEWSTCDDLPSRFHEIIKILENQWKSMKINGFGASQDSTVPGGTRPSPESAKT